MRAYAAGVWHQSTGHDQQGESGGRYAGRQQPVGSRSHSDAQEVKGFPHPGHDSRSTYGGNRYNHG